MMVRSKDALDVRSDPWPTGRQRKPAPPTVPARPAVLHTYRRPPPRPIDLRAPRPPVVDDTSLVGFSRLTRSRVGGRIYRLAITALFALIVVQMLVAMMGY